jgi:hypothetical protein
MKGGAFPETPPHPRPLPIKGRGGLLDILNFINLSGWTGAPLPR